MTWELASFAVLALALGAGFVWWERHRPSSRVLALVATLAALAALGRVAFAPLPNVKPTTDIALLSGYVLGGAPGFAVGAVGALASNLVFGQGPWTPWQMAAWGLCGIGGAGLARVAGRDVGRVGLAAACGAAGLVYGAILDYSDWVTFSGSHTLGQYLVRSGASLPFNVAHAVGNVVFCLLFGPAFVRALRRFRARLDVTWTTPAPSTAAAAARARGAGARGRPPSLPLARRPARARAPPPTSPAPRTPTAGSARRRARGRPASTAPGRPSASAPRTATPTACGAAAARWGPTSPGSPAASAAPGTWSARSSPCGRPAARRAALRGRMHRGQRRDGSWDGLVNLTAFGVLAVRAAGDGARSAAARRGAAFLTRAQHRDGGFGVAGRGGPSDVDVTGAVVQALVAAGRPRSVRRRSPARRASSRPGSTRTAGSARARARARTPSRPRSRSRACSPPGAARAGCTAGARGRRWPTCARSSPPPAPSATRARAPRRRSGSPPRRSRRWPGVRCRSAGDDARPRRRGAPRRAAARRIG